MPEELAVPTGTGESTDDQPPAAAGLDSRVAVESTVLSFGRALGGEPTTLSDLPFTERPDGGGVAEELYVRHDDDMLRHVSRWLVGGEHVALTSDPGTGKTTLRSVIERDLGRRWDFVVATVDAPGAVTERGLSEALLRAATRAGYGVHPDDYWQVDDGVPWLTDEMSAAVTDVTDQMAADEATPVLLVDGVERLDPARDAALGALAEAGVQLCLLGTPATERRLGALGDRLDDPLRTYEGIDRFDERAIAEYVARSLSWFRDEAYDSTAADLFSGDAISYVLAETDGNPRAVRDACFELFVRAAVVWDRLDVSIDRVTITSALAERDLDPVLARLPRLTDR